MMGERVIAGLTMIVAEPALSDAAKRKMKVGKMNKGIVETAAAESNLLDYTVVSLAVVGKEIKGKRPGQVFDPGYHLG